MTKSHLPEYMAPKDTLEEFYIRLHDAGYNLIGSGAYARAYTNGEHVVKVAVDDEGYDMWLEECLKNQGNPWFPVIHDVKRFKDVRSYGMHRKVTVVSMEVLEKNAKRYSSMNPRKYYNWRQAKQYKGKSKLEQKLVASLNEIKQRRGWLDLQAGNVLFRGKHPVFTDPVA